MPFLGRNLFTYNIRHHFSVCTMYLTVVFIYAVNGVLQQNQLHWTLWDFLKDNSENVSYIYRGDVTVYKPACEHLTSFGSQLLL